MGDPGGRCIRVIVLEGHDQTPPAPFDCASGKEIIATKMACIAESVVSAEATERIQTNMVSGSEKGDLPMKIVAAVSLMTVCRFTKFLFSSILETASTINEGLALPEAYRPSARIQNRLRMF